MKRKAKALVVDEMTIQIRNAEYRQKKAEAEARDERNKRLTLETKLYDLWRVLQKPVEILVKEMNEFGFGDHRSLRTRLMDRIKAYEIDPDADISKIARQVVL